MIFICFAIYFMIVSARSDMRILILKQISQSEKSQKINFTDSDLRQQIAIAAGFGFFFLSALHSYFMPSSIICYIDSIEDKIWLVNSSKTKTHYLAGLFLGSILISEITFMIFCLQFCFIISIIIQSLCDGYAIRYYIINNKLSMFKPKEVQDRTASLDVLQDFQINTKDDWTNWQFEYQEQKDIPIALTNKYNFYKNVKYCDLNAVGKHEQVDYMMVEAIAKKKNKQYISKNAKVTEKRVQGNPTTKQYTKKVQKFWRPWTNQNKTNFKKITVKNHWKQIKTINKNILEGLPKTTAFKVQELKNIGKVNTIDPKINRISWTPIRFKENQQYQLNKVTTSQNKTLIKCAQYIYNNPQSCKNYNVLCAPEFLLNILTLRGSVYPWNISIIKQANMITLQSYRTNDQNNDLNYLDLYIANQNTTNHMPIDENKVKQTCINATKLTKVFQDLLASGEEADIDLGEESEIFKKTENQDAQEQQEQQEDDEEEEEPQKLRKYLKISVGQFDVFTYVDIDGVKETQEQFQKYLIRIFMQSETQGAWIKDMKTSPGSIITKEYHANNCSIQKWICQARLAGVEKMKFGYMGYEQNKPVLLNVSEVTVEGLEKTLSFKLQTSWGILNYIIDLVSKQQDGTYVLAKAPYTPLSIKLYQIATSKEQDEQQDDQGSNN